LPGTRSIFFIFNDYFLPDATKTINLTFYLLFFLYFYSLILRKLRNFDMVSGSILFICTQNACRSQMAEGFARKIADKNVTIRSAGTEPAEINPRAISAMKELDIDISAQKSKSIADLDVDQFDLVITLCDRARQTCPVLPGAPNTVHWDVEDPATATGSETAIKKRFLEIAGTIRHLVSDLFKRGYYSAFVNQKRNLESILSSLPQGVMAHDRQRRIA